MHHTGIKTLADDTDAAATIRFHLHHTGIKTIDAAGVLDEFVVFQLHHTGIKTHKRGGTGKGLSTFQLHHTGIKTPQELVPPILRLNFNCTIQELKPIAQAAFFLRSLDFNCTIQELKQDIIKGVMKKDKISIAPYRN